MSTKTTFKRIALVAVAALGLGVLSVAPSSATTSALTVTGTNGTSTNSSDAAVSDSTTAAVVTISALLDSASDSITVAFVKKSAPATATAVPFAYYLDSTTSSASSTFVDSITATNVASTVIAGVGQKKYTGAGSADTNTAAIAVDSTLAFRITRGANAGYVGAKFAVQLDSYSARIAGTYTYTAIVKTYSVSAAGALSVASTTTQDVSIVVAAAVADDTVVVPSSSTAYMSKGAAFVAGTTSDSAVALVATASATDQAVIRVVTKNANGNGAAESITATITGPGVIGLAGGTTYGKSITVAGTGSTDLGVRADGTAGVGSIVIKTTSQTFPAKTVSFFAKAAKTITLAVNQPVIGVTSATDVIRATAVDADGNVWGGTAYIYAASAADALIAGSETPVACTFNSTYGFHSCPVAGTAKGTANFKVIDASTVALATATSASAAVRVSTGIATTAKISFDKAAYAPGEKATVLVTVLDADGNAMPATTVTAAFSAAPTSNIAFSTGSDTLLADAAIAGATSATSKTTAGSKQYTIYMPYASGDVTISATGGTGLALAGRVAVSATASVVNSSVDAATDAANEATDAANAATDAALAAADAADAATAAAQDASDAVAALSATVAKLVASLKAQITSLTNLVIKIQKKVKA
ncbi:hypothetical protein MCERE155_00058 [Candidatus Nanopelagicaceae bacterium]